MNKIVCLVAIVFCVFSLKAQGSEGQVTEHLKSCLHYQTVFSFEEGNENLASLKKLKVEDLKTCWNALDNVIVLNMDLQFNDLESLDLSDNKMEDEVFCDIIWSLLPRAPKLSDLDLSGNDLTGEPFKAITAFCDMRNLQVLNLRGSRLGDEGAQVLSNLEGLENLRSLNLASNGLYREGAEAIAGATDMVNLTDLDLSDNELDCKGALAIAKSKRMEKLVILRLSRNKIGDAGAYLIQHSFYMRNLKKLYLASNQIGRIGCLAIAYSGNFNNHLTALDLLDNPIDSESQATLRRRIPCAKISGK